MRSVTRTGKQTKVLPDVIELFLDFLCTTVARKPRRLKLQQTARVARYLDAVAEQLPEGDGRAGLERLTETLWLAIRRLTQVKFAEKQKVIGFLQHHAHTYLNSFSITEIVKLIESRPEPTGRPFRPATLMGTGRSYSSQGPARLQNDLTERIFVGYEVLRRAGVRNAGRKIADALNRYGFATGARGATATTWGPYEVGERVKQFQSRLNRVSPEQLRKLPKGLSKAAFLKNRRDGLVDSWISEFHRSVSPRARKG